MADLNEAELLARMVLADPVLSSETPWRVDEFSKRAHPDSIMVIGLDGVSDLQDILPGALSWSPVAITKSRVDVAEAIVEAHRSAPLLARAVLELLQLVKEYETELDELR